MQQLSDLDGAPHRKTPNQRAHDTPLARLPSDRDDSRMKWILAIHTISNITFTRPDRPSRFALPHPDPSSLLSAFPPQLRVSAWEDLGLQHSENEIPGNQSFKAPPNIPHPHTSRFDEDRVNSKSLSWGNCWR